MGIILFIAVVKNFVFAQAEMSMALQEDNLIVDFSETVFEPSIIQPLDINHFVLELTELVKQYASEQLSALSTFTQEQQEHIENLTNFAKDHFTAAAANDNIEAFLSIAKNDLTITASDLEHAIATI